MEERERVEQTIRDAVESGLSTGVGGTLAELARIGEATDVPYARDTGSGADIRHLDVVEIDGDRATANLDATISLTATQVASGAQFSWEVLANGPVILERTDGAWAVVDIALNGLRVSDTHRAGDLARGGSADDLVRARMVGVFGSRKSATAYADVENRSTGAIHIRRAAAGVRRRRLPGWKWCDAHHAAEELRPGTTRIQLAANAGGASRTRDLRLLLETEHGVVDVRPERARPRARLPLSNRYPTLAWLVVVTLVAVACARLTTWSVAGIVLFTMAAPAALQLGSTPGLARRYPQFMLSRLSVAAVGLGLFVWPYLFPGPTVEPSQGGSRLTQLLRERGVRLGAAATSQDPHALSSAWAAFREFSGIRASDALGEVYFLELGGDGGRGLALAFVRQIYARSDDVWTIALQVRVPPRPSQAVLSSTGATRCRPQEGCALRCTFDEKTFVGRTCRLHRADDRSRPLLAAFASSFETGGTSADEQRTSWARFVEQSYVFRRISSLSASRFRFDVTATSAGGGGPPMPSPIRGLRPRPASGSTAPRGR